MNYIPPTPIYAPSAGLYIIKNRLIIGNISQYAVWYKDEGGREKSINIPVYLVNANDERVLKRRIHLKCTLLYQNGNNK
jgi:hypothetical protein